MKKITYAELDGTESHITLTPHHFIYCERSGKQLCIPARDVNPETDQLFIRDSSGKIIKNSILSAENITAADGVCNIITMKTYSVIANNVQCSVHTEGDGGDSFFNVVSFFYKYISKDSLKLAYKINKGCKKLLGK